MMAANGNKSNNGCSLSTCGHTCSLCGPILQHLLRLCQITMQKQSSVTNMATTNIIRQLLPIIASGDPEKLEQYFKSAEVLDAGSTAEGTDDKEEGGRGGGGGEQTHARKEEDQSGGDAGDDGCSKSYRAAPSMPPELLSLILCMIASLGSPDCLQLTLGHFQTGIEGQPSVAEAALLMATLENKPRNVRMLLQWNAALLHTSVTRSSCNNIAHCAAHSGSTDVLLMVSSIDPSLMSETNVDKATPLHCAAHAGQEAAMRLIMAATSKSKKENIGESEGDDALKPRKQEIRQQAVEQREVIVDVVDCYGDTPLMKAISNGHIECVQLLLRFRAQVNLCNNGGDSPFRKAIFHGYTDIAKLLISSGAQWTTRSATNISALHLSAFKGHLDATTFLLHNLGVDVDSRDDQRMTPLFFATVNNHIDIVRLLLKFNCDVDATDTDGKTSLHTCARKGNYEICQLLLDAKASVNVKDNVSWTPLHECTSEGSSAVVQLLIERGADVTIVDKDGCTALHLAARCGTLPSLQVLLDSGAQVSKCDNSMWTPLHEAANEGHADCLKALLEADSAMIDRGDAEAGYTALHKGADRSSLACVQLLVQYNADVRLLTHAGASALDLARVAQAWEVARYLVKIHDHIDSILEADPTGIGDKSVKRGPSSDSSTNNETSGSSSSSSMVDSLQLHACQQSVLALNDRLQQTMCLTCGLLRRDALLLPCLHFQHCLQCAQHVLRKQAACPQCQMTVNAVLPVKY